MDIRKKEEQELLERLRIALEGNKTGRFTVFKSSSKNYLSKKHVSKNGIKENAIKAIKNCINQKKFVGTENPLSLISNLYAACILSSSDELKGRLEQNFSNELTYDIQQLKQSLYTYLEKSGDIISRAQEQVNTLPTSVKDKYSFVEKKTGSEFFASCNNLQEIEARIEEIKILSLQSDLRRDLDIKGF